MPRGGGVRRRRRQGHPSPSPPPPVPRPSHDPPSPPRRPLAALLARLLRLLLPFAASPPPLRLPRLCDDATARAWFAGRAPAVPRHLCRRGDVTVVDADTGEVVLAVLRGAVSRSARSAAMSALAPLTARTRPYEAYGLVRNAPSSKQVAKGTRVASYMLGHARGVARSRFWDDTPGLHGAGGLAMLHAEAARAHRRLFPEAHAAARAHVGQPLADGAPWDSLIVNVLSGDAAVSNLTRMGVHRDRGDFARGVSTLVALAGGGEAGPLVLPHYGFGVEMAPGDAAFYQAHVHWHGVAEGAASGGGGGGAMPPRVTAVLYASN